MKWFIRRLDLIIFFLWLLSLGCHPKQLGIDRMDLVSRHNVINTKIDTLGSLTVGNGEFAFTVDVTGLQSFPDVYQNGIPLATQSQWGWHSFPNPEKYTNDDVAEVFASCNDRQLPVATQHGDGRAGAATQWLRTNPHRLHLGIIGLQLLKNDGEEMQINDVKDIEQTLDLWSGKITSVYKVENIPVRVELVAHEKRDLIAFKIESPLISSGNLKIRMKFPYGSDCHTCDGADWNHPEKHQSIMTESGENEFLIHRILDSTEYEVVASFAQNISYTEAGDHHFIFSPAGDEQFLEGSILFKEDFEGDELPTFSEAVEDSRMSYQKFWEDGGAIDFSQCSDPRAFELERRVILSQYLTKVNCSGSLPPQETGLTCNSWYGKFHLEMHWWHGVHFALWNRLQLLEKSLPWYDHIIEDARHKAEWQGFAGVRWPKMVGPEGRSSPSNVGEFLIWQQPHPIYFAELVYQQKPDRATLEKYRDIVFSTADFMASFAQYKVEDQSFHLCHPLIPAQEIFHAEDTNDPPFELAYWHFALDVAQDWRKRLGLQRDSTWQNVLDYLAPLPEYNGLYLPCAGAIDAYTDRDLRRDHPIVLGAYGMLPGDHVDAATMKRTFLEIMRDWNWKTTWGWDYPMIAMTAARLGEPEMAIEILFKDTQKNTYLNNGHNYQDKRLRLYLPGNGALLAAVAMMAAGWTDSDELNPGFPKDGKWNVKWEGLRKML